MSKKELDTLVEQYFRTDVWTSPTLNLEMLIEMIEDNYPDISAADPAGIGVDGVNPELVADKVAASGDVSREGVISVLTQLIGSADPGMVDRVMLQISNPQGLSVKGAPQAQINESLTAEQWAKMYRELLLMGVPADTMEAIRILKDSGLTAEQLKGMLSQQTMTDLKSVQTAPVTGVGDRWPLEEDKRFSMSIPIPKLIPTEAWGEPGSQGRQEIEEVFSVIKRKGDIRTRIAHVNSFLEPETAKKKAPRRKGERQINTLLNMMMIIEALQATLNDYNESAAGFVFEAFMAALTGGEQISDRIGGTLPIEDFTADGENVSLKLLSPDTNIHGSFTNLIDYLFLRGESGVPQVKYLIALKDVEGDDVSQLRIFDFMITRENFAEVMVQSKNHGLFGKGLEDFRALAASFQPTPEWRLAMFRTLKVMPGYTENKGMFYKNLDAAGAFDEKAGGPADPAKKRGAFERVGAQGLEIDAFNRGKEEAADGKPRNEKAYTLKDKKEWLRKLQKVGIVDAETGGLVIDPKTDKKPASDKRAAKLLKKLRAQYEKGFEHAEQQSADADVEDFHKSFETPVTESFFGEFHEAEKRMMAEEILMEGKGEGSQWGISRTQMTAMVGLIKTDFYGTINLSSKNIEQMSEIYSEILGDELMDFLKKTKEFTESIGKYFSAPRRDSAMNANKKAKVTGKEIVEKLAEDPAERGPIE